MIRGVLLEVFVQLVGPVMNLVLVLIGPTGLLNDDQFSVHVLTHQTVATGDFTVGAEAGLGWLKVAHEKDLQYVAQPIAVEVLRHHVGIKRVRETQVLEDVGPAITVVVFVLGVEDTVTVRVLNAQPDRFHRQVRVRVAAGVEDDLFRRTVADFNRVWPEALAVLQLAVAPAFAAPLAVKPCSSDAIGVGHPCAVPVVLVHLAVPHGNPWALIRCVEEVVDDVVQHHALIVFEDVNGAVLPAHRRPLTAGGALNVDRVILVGVHVGGQRDGVAAVVVHDAREVILSAPTAVKGEVDVIGDVAVHGPGEGQIVARLHRGRRGLKGREGTVSKQVRTCRGVHVELLVIRDGHPVVKGVHRRHRVPNLNRQIGPCFGDGRGRPGGREIPPTGVNKVTRVVVREDVLHLVGAVGDEAIKRDLVIEIIVRVVLMAHVGVRVRIVGHMDARSSV